MEKFRFTNCLSSEIRLLYYLNLCNKNCLEILWKDPSAREVYLRACMKTTGFADSIKTSKRIIKELKNDNRS